MPAIQHYARTIPYDQLVAELEAARAERLVYTRSDGAVQLWCYTSKAVYDRGWTPAIIAARGLVLDRDRRCVIATPFPKFFNVGELGEPVPDEPCEIFEKVDGSLIVIFHDGHRWRTATKGSLESAQARWAELRLADMNLSPFVPGTTYLAEAIYPENVIIVRYDEAALVLLGAYHADGVELTTPELAATASQLGWRMARREAFAGVADALAHAETLPATEEGYVLRFASGLRLKAKGNAYRRLHALISRVTPLGLWDALFAGDDMAAMRRLVPEEFWSDFDAILTLLTTALDAKLAAIATAAAAVAHLSDKELGLAQKTLPQETARFLFTYRRNPDLLRDAKARQVLLRDIRPVANVLVGYEPSYAIQRIAADE